MTPLPTHTWWAPDTVSSTLSVGIIAISSAIFIWKRRQKPAIPALPLGQTCRCSNVNRHFSQISATTDHQVFVVLLSPRSNTRLISNEISRAPAFHEVLTSPANPSVSEPRRVDSKTLPESAPRPTRGDGHERSPPAAVAKREPDGTSKRQQAVDGKERPASGDVKMRSRSKTDTLDPRADDEDRRSARSWLKQRSTSKILGRK
jgi:hypothetical protein